MEISELGRVCEAGEEIVRQGELGDCMYVIQEGAVEVLVERDGRQVPIAVRREGEFFGEMALFEHEARSATVRALGRTRVLTVDKRNLLRRIHQDPALGMRIVQAMSHRIRELSQELARLRETT